MLYEVITPRRVSDATGLRSERHGRGPSETSAQLLRPDRGEHTDNRGDRDENACPGDSQGQDTIRADVVDEVTVEQSGHEADEAHHAESYNFV